MKTAAAAAGGDGGGGEASPNLSMLYHVSVSSDGITYFIYFIMCCDVQCGAVKVGKAGLAGGDEMTSG